MRCEEARPLISAELDGELQGGRGDGLRGHLAGCELCRAERAALAGTVRLLRTVLEAEPPAELRRRIGVALLEEERRAQRRRHVWTWLARPQTAGWAWGAAAGALVAAITLVNTNHGTRPTLQKVASHPVVRSSRRIAAAPTTSADVKPGVVRKPVRIALTQPAQPPPKTDEPKVTAVLPPAQPMTAEAPPPLPVGRTPAARPPTNSRGHAPGRSRRSVRIGPALTAPPPPAHHGAPKEEKSVPRPDSADRETPRVAWMNPPTTNSSPDADPLDSEDSSDTSNMQQMASSTPMTASPGEEKDDLDELRHRLTDRPLDVPQLGQLKAPTAGTTHRDGWIRF
jgi:hypothetical protein